MYLSPLVCRVTYSKTRGFLWHACFCGDEGCSVVVFAVCIGTDHLSRLCAAQIGFLVTLQARGVQGQLYSELWKANQVLLSEGSEKRTSSSEWRSTCMECPSTLSVLHTNAQSLWGLGFPETWCLEWWGRGRGVSVLLLPVTLGEPLNFVFSFFNLPSGGKKQNLFLLHEILKDQSVKLLGSFLN